jgi:hypothetical protein
VSLTIRYQPFLYHSKLTSRANSCVMAWVVFPFPPGLLLAAGNGGRLACGGGAKLVGIGLGGPSDIEWGKL